MSQCVWACEKREAAYEAAMMTQTYSEKSRGMRSQRSGRVQQHSHTT